MKFKKSEKEIIKTIVKHGGSVISLADVINKSHLLEKKGIAILPNNRNLMYIRKDMYEDWDDKEPYGYIAEFASLLQYLIDNRLLIPIPYNGSTPLVIGKEKSSWGMQGTITVNDGEGIITPEHEFFYWFEKGQQAYWPCECSENFLPISQLLTDNYTISKELQELVKHNFKSEEERRFAKQQCLTWISIIIAGLIGLGSLIINMIMLLKQ